MRSDEFIHPLYMLTSKRRTERPVQRRPILEEVTSQRKYPLDIAKQFFGPESSAAKAQRLKIENPAEYNEMHKDAEHYGLIAAPSYFVPERDALSPERRTFTPDELRVRQEFSEADINRLFKTDPKNANPSESLAKIAQSDPAKYARIKAAAISYGVLPPESATPVHQQPKAQPKADEAFVVSADFCQKFRVPEGTKMTHPEFDAAVSVYLEHEQAQRIAAQNAPDQGQQ